MADRGLLRILAKPTFDVDRFVKNTIQNDGIESTLNQLSRMCVSVCDQVKSTIFSNFKLFLKIGKVATQLEATMHQIHSDFTEKERIMNAMAELSYFGSAIDVLESDTGDNAEQDQDEMAIQKEVFLVSNRQSVRQKGIGYTNMSIADLAEHVDGALSLTGNPNRYVIFDGDLRELSAETATVIREVHVFLLTDCLIIAFNQLGRSSNYHYRLQASYDLFNVAVTKIPMRDRRHTPLHTFKLSVMPTTRLFQAKSREEKSTWIRVVNEAKQACRESQRAQSTEAGQASPLLKVQSKSAPQPDSPASVQVYNLPPYAVLPSEVSKEVLQAALKALSSTLPQCASMLTQADTVKPFQGRRGGDSQQKSSSRNRRNPFNNNKLINEECENVSGDDQSDSSKTSTNWLWEIPEDLEVAIAERNLPHATDLIVRATPKIEKILASSAPDVDDSTNGCDHTTKARDRADWEDLLRRVKASASNLSEKLQYELLTAADRHGAPRIVRATIVQLNRLGKANLAAQLFLVYRSNLLARSISSGVRQEASQLIFLCRLSMMFHRQLAEAYAEWRQSVVLPMAAVQSEDELGTTALRQTPSGTEKLLDIQFHSWLLEEASKFGRQLYALLVDNRSMSFQTVVQSAQRIRAHSEKIAELLGVDVFSALSGSLLQAWKRAAEDQARVLCDAIEHRYQTEIWEPLTADSENDVSSQYARELHDIGVLDASVFGPDSPPLTMAMCQAIRSVYQFVQNGRRLACPELDPYFIKLLGDILRTEVDSFQMTIKGLSGTSDPNRTKQVLVMRKNFEFMMTHVLPRITSLLDVSYSPDITELLSTFR